MYVIYIYIIYIYLDQAAYSVWTIGLFSKPKQPSRVYVIHIHPRGFAFEVSLIALRSGRRGKVSWIVHVDLADAW